MAQFIEGNHKAFLLPASLTNFEQYSRVVVSGGSLSLASSTQREVGVLSRFPSVAGQPADVILKTANGTVPMVAGGTISAYANVFAAANGRISQLDNSTASSYTIGVALQAATGAGDLVEVLRQD